MEWMLAVADLLPYDDTQLIHGVIRDWLSGDRQVEIPLLVVMVSARANCVRRSPPQSIIRNLFRSF